METKEKRFIRLGYNEEGTQEIVEKINALLCDYHVHYQKLRNFHWNVTGHDFFDLHEKFEEMYNFAHENIDSLAERIRVFGARPISRLADYLENSKIKEPVEIVKPEAMVEEILDDLEIVLSKMMAVLNAASSAGDVSTVDMIQKMVQKSEKDYWMLSAWLQ